MHGLEALIGWLTRPRNDEDETVVPTPRADADRLIPETDRDGPATVVPLAYPLSRCHIFGVCP